jgi:S-adenosylmethionine synthetase
MISDIHQISTERERQSDLEFARKAVEYLGRKGLGPDEVVDYLVEELGLDRDTARALAVVAA